MKRLATLAPLAALLALADSRPASACSLLTNDDFQEDPAQAGDATPPGAVTGSAEVFRNEEEEGVGCTQVAGCGDIAAIRLDVSATDNATPADRMGYLVTVVGGEPPAGLVGESFGGIRSTPVTGYGGELIFYFDFNDRAGFQLDLEVRAVDLGGNLGPPTIFSVGEAAPDEGGCRTSGSATSGGLVLLAIAGVVLRRRARRSTLARCASPSR